MQLRWETKLTCQAYISERAWREQRLQTCPCHPRGKCGFASHGAYLRKDPEGLWVRRWYCPKAHQSFSLLPEFAAARLTGTLQDIEDVVIGYDADRGAGATAQQAAQRARPDIEPQGALRWMRRRLHWAQAALTLLMGCASGLVLEGELKICAVKHLLGCAQVLLEVRRRAAANLTHVPKPLGLAPPKSPAKARCARHQHESGPDPPAADAAP